MSLSVQSEKIGKFVLGLFDADRPTPTPDRIIVRHLSASDRQSDVGTVSMPEEPGDDGAPLVKVADQISELIETDADGLGGVQRYLLLGMHGSDIVGRLPVRVAGGADDNDGDALDSEPATLRGLVSQLMRHNEANSRIVSLSFSQIISTMLRQMDRMRAVAEEAEDKRFEASQLIEQLHSGEHDRALEKQALELRAQTLSTSLAALLPAAAELIKSAGAGKFGNVAGFVSKAATMLAGGDAVNAPEEASEPGAALREAEPSISPRGASPSELGAFLGMLSPGQKMKIFELLTPEQQAMLIGLATQLAADDDAAGASTTEASAGPG